MSLHLDLHVLSLGVIVNKGYEGCSITRIFEENYVFIEIPYVGIQQTN